MAQIQVLVELVSVLTIRIGIQKAEHVNKLECIHHTVTFMGRDGKKHKSKALLSTFRKLR